MAKAPIYLILLISLCSPLHAQTDIIGDLIEQQKIPTEKKWVIVIDPGHGGKDSGAIGHHKMQEKDIVLQISRRIAKDLKKQLPADVYLTRASDRFISLEGRDQIAIQKKADVFLSIHANAAKRKEANGIEIYYLNNATDQASDRLADRENRGSHKSLSDLKKILSTLVQTESTDLSRLLAHEVHQSLQEHMRRYQPERLQVKTALFYVLVGSQAPSILLEVGFLTNPKEARRLSQKQYQELFAQAVVKGVERYLNVVKLRKVNL